MENWDLCREADLPVATNARSECGECAAAAAATKRKHCPSPTSPKRPRAERAEQHHRNREEHKLLHAEKVIEVQNTAHVAEKSAGLAEVLGCSSENTRNHRISNRESSSDEDAVFSYRLEHRSRISPSLAIHPNEERILIFASNQPGVVAKIIFSAAALTAGPSASETVRSASVNGGDGTIEARIHVLEVKASHRGHDLGGLLFVEAMNALRSRYTDRKLRCHLDAEEDDKRFGRLTGFYSRLGCCVKPNAKVQYLHNNDGETYRKVPMVISLSPTDVPVYLSIAASDLSSNCKFSPVSLHIEDGSDVAFWDHSSASDGERRNRKLKWILIDDGSGHFQFRTTCGYRLFASSCGEVRIGQGNNSDPLVFRFSSASDSPDCNVVSDSDESDYDLGHKEHDCRSLASIVPPGEMWLVQATCSTRLFLSTDPCTGSLFLSPRPTPWRVNPKEKGLTCLAKQSQRRVQHRNSWRYQNVANVTAWRCKYWSFNLCTMSLKHCLDLASSIPLDPFSEDVSSPRFISLRTFCYYTAEQFRCDGRPDWYCFIALIHELGRCVRLLEKRGDIGADESSKDEDDKDDYDWTVACRSRIVGCSTPVGASLAGLRDEFRTLCHDEEDPLFSTELGIYEQGCGLCNVLMQWTGPEYMYWMLRHNGAMLPELALHVIRYFPLSGWHRRGEYSDLTNTLDNSFRDTVSDFDERCRISRRECEGVSEISDSECEKLWQSFYFPIAAKYGCHTDMSW